MEKKKGAMIQYICNNHKDKGVQETDFSHLHNYKYGCPYCSGRKKTTEEIQNEIKNEDVVLISEYMGNEKPIKCKCKKCNYEWITQPKVLITNGAGCPKCGRKKANINEMKSMDGFIKELYQVNPDIEIIGEYKGTHRRIKCRCKKDGYIWEGNPARMLRREAGCPLCNISLGEKHLLETLDKIGVTYISQYPIDVGAKREYRFDAYDNLHKIAFEYNGEQHYRPVDFAGKGKDWAENEFKRVQLRDKNKINYCVKNSITLVIVPYWEKENMENFIKNQLLERGVKI